jgi:hypothetical protein
MAIAEIIKQLCVFKVLNQYHLKPNRNKMVCRPL